MKELYEQRAERILRGCYDLLSEVRDLEDMASSENFPDEDLKYPISTQKNDYNYIQDVRVWLNMSNRVPIVLSLNSISMKKLKESSILPLYEDGEQGVREEEIIQDEKRKEISKALSALTPRERHVIKEMIYENKTLSDIAREFGTSHSSVWILKNNALKKLRHPLIKERLEAYYIK